MAKPRINTQKGTWRKRLLSLTNIYESIYLYIVLFLSMSISIGIEVVSFEMQNKNPKKEREIV